MLASSNAIRSRRSRRIRSPSTPAGIVTSTAFAASSTCRFSRVCQARSTPPTAMGTCTRARLAVLVSSRTLSSASSMVALTFISASRAAICRFNFAAAPRESSAPTSTVAFTVRSMRSNASRSSSLNLRVSGRTRIES